MSINELEDAILIKSASRDKLHRYKKRNSSYETTADSLIFN